MSKSLRHSHHDVIAAHEAWDSAHRSWSALVNQVVSSTLTRSEEDALEVQIDASLAEQTRILDRLVEIPAPSVEAILARLRTLALWDKELVKEATNPDADPAHRTIAAALRDLAALDAASAETFVPAMAAE